MLQVLERPGVRAAAMAIDVETYRKIFEGKKTELIQGVVIEKMPKTKLHEGVLEVLWHFLVRHLRENLRATKEAPITLVDSEPEPDIAIVQARHSIYDEHPTYAYMVAEVSVTTQALDSDKAEMYAKGEIPSYWNILPLEKVTVVYENPVATGYTSVTRVPWSEKLTLKLPGQQIEVLLGDILK